MEYIFVVFDSLSVTNRAKRLAKKASLSPVVVQLPSDLGIRGCSYGLRIKPNDYNFILNIANEYDLTIKTAFIQKNIDGRSVYNEL